MSDRKCLIYCGGSYVFIAFVLVITTTSWMINVTNRGYWQEEINNLYTSNSLAPTILINSWK